MCAGWCHCPLQQLCTQHTCVDCPSPLRLGGDRLGNEVKKRGCRWTSSSSSCSCLRLCTSHCSCFLCRAHAPHHLLRPASPPLLSPAFPPFCTPTLNAPTKHTRTQILICQNLRNNLQHPNEYIRGVTLRFLCRIREEEILEPLVPSILANLDHR